MSFILEALKKVERKKGDDSEEGVLMQGGRRWGETRFPWGLVGAVLVAIVALALASVALMRSFSGGDSGGEVETRGPAAAMDGQAPPSASASISAPVVEVEDDAPAISSSPDEAPQERPEPDSPVENAGQTETAEPAEPAKPAKPAEIVPSEGDPGEPEETEEIAIGAAPPVTLVGRASDGLAPPKAEADTIDQPPSELPPLVLQGTSVIDGRPVAVVNYQRLFEGDYIEGARVVKILDRVVELEFQGTHFSLRL